MSVQAIIALGSNLENPAVQVKEALAVLSECPDIQLIKASSLYQTAPVGYLDQPMFINAVALVETSLSAKELLTQLQLVENQFGRVRTFSNAPRVLDLDLIDYNHEFLQTDFLVLPHPRAHERAFVMVPLSEIAPDYALAGKDSAANLLSTLDQSGVEPYPS